ncbi:MAG: NAD(P)/FAD-dependent oxidoreductase [Taibaiella sp.]|nr:NAD(P)/FAD-dependent oxidoreductase [Taibaiella sp.]
MSKRKKLVIIGAGFAGLQLARRLKGTDYDITLIDQFNFHQFQPLFYQVATARLEPSSVSFPLRKVFQGAEHVHVRVTKLERIDRLTNMVRTADGDFAYDYLVIATGCTNNFFGNKNFEKYSFTMKSTNEAITLRNRILLSFEDALSAGPDEIAEIMTIVITGGGPTGVELAGALAEMKKYVLPRDYPDMDFSRLKICLVEGGPTTLGVMSDAAQNKSQQYLKDLGVELMLNTLAEDYDGHTLTLKNGTKIKTRTLIWAAGIKGNVPDGIPDETVVKGGRIKTDEYNLMLGSNNIFVLGDVAYMETIAYPKGHPQLANVAVNQAKNLAKNFKKLLNGKTMTPFKYKSPGTMATIGKHKAVVDLPSFSFQGRLAWFTWMFLHLMLILSVRNKFFIFLNWAISYFTNDTTLRLILLPTRKEKETAKPA